MGKRRKRLTMAKYAKKYAKKREALGLSQPTVKSALIQIDANGQEEKQEEQVQVVTNEPVEEKKEVQAPPWTPEPELQVVQIEEPVKEEVVDVETPKPSKRRTTRKKTTTRRRTTKKTEK